MPVINIAPTASAQKKKYTAINGYASKKALKRSIASSLSSCPTTHRGSREGISQSFKAQIGIALRFDGPTSFISRPEVRLRSVQLETSVPTSHTVLKLKRE
jgi:hypothetical protein